MHRAMASALTVLLLGGTAGCGKPEQAGGTKPPFELKDQIMVDGDKSNLRDIKSAIYTVEGEEYTFYLSPYVSSANTGLLENILTAGDVLEVRVKNPSGTVNVSEEDFSIRYLDFSVNKVTMEKDFKTVELSVDYLEESRHLNLEIYLETNSGHSLRVSYHSTAAPNVGKVYPIMYNKNLTVIRSAVTSHNRAKGQLAYYLLDKADFGNVPDESYDGKYMCIKMPSSLATGRDIDLATAKEKGIEISFDGKSSAYTSLQGTLAVEERPDKRVLDIRISNARLGGKKLMADYRGDYTASNETRSKMYVTMPGEGTKEYVLNSFYNDNSASFIRNSFAVGDYAAPQSPEDLKKGRFVVEFYFQGSNCDFDASMNKTDFTFMLHDYETSTTYRSYPDGKGHLKVKTEQGTGVTLVDFDILFSDVNIRVQGSWYDMMIPFAYETVDFSPASNLTSAITLISPDGLTVTEKLGISAMQVRHTEERIDGSATAYPLYYLYFINKNTETNGVDSPNATPCLRIYEDIINTGKRDLPKLKDAPFWQIDYTKFSNNPLGSPVNPNSYPNNPPQYGFIDVTRDEEDNWKVSFRVRDDVPGVQGTKAYIAIEWDGPASPYEGYKENDLLD